jgi:predicted DNA-binding antitoxin AbrB/MazE fold protein
LLQEGLAVEERELEAVYENGVLRPIAPEQLGELRPGETVMVRVRPLTQSQAGPENLTRREAELLKRLEAEGALAHFLPPAKAAPETWQPLVMSGEPFSEELIRLRGERN